MKAVSVIYGIIRVAARVPLRVAYAGSSALAWLLADVVRYRRKVVLQNLSSAFPEMPKREIKKTARRFYRFLTDYCAETVHLAAMSEREMRRRMEFRGMEAINEVLRQGRCVSIFLGHYGNWEWISSMPLHLEPSAHACQLYHELRNKTADRIFLRLRSRFGADSVPKQNGLKVVAGDYRKGIANVTGYIADQVPNYHSIHHFVPFLSHDTPVFSGAERISKMVHAAAFYADVEVLGRGRYRCTMHKMADDVATLPQFALTEEYYRRMEATIRRAPAYWLWSHRRWKRTREQFKELYPEEYAKRLSHL